jgi:hypothetical protein
MVLAGLAPFVPSCALNRAGVGVCHAIVRRPAATEHRSNNTYG